MRVSAGTVSDLNQKMYERIETWRNRPITGVYPYVYLDGISLKRTWGGEVRNVAVLVAVGVGTDGYRDILGIAEGCKEDKAGWSGFLAYLKKRGLKCPELIISDKCLGLIESLAEYYPEAQWQRCMVHFYRNVFSVVPKGKVKQVAAMLKAIHAQEDRQAAQEKADAVVAKLRALRLSAAAELVREGIGETLTYYAFPDKHHRQIRTNNPLERLMREIRRRSRVVGCFPDGRSALMLAAARLRYIAATQWGTRRYMNMDRLKELKQERQEAACLSA
jgi:transposase-like protein